MGLLGVLCLMVTVLTACGFHLRGSQDFVFSSLVIESELKSPLVEALSKAIAQRGVQVSDTGDVHLFLAQERLEKTAVQVGREGKSSEYALLHTIDIYLSEGKPVGERVTSLLPSQFQSLQVLRRYAFDAAQLLAKQEEETIIRQEMQDELVEKILLRLQQFQFSQSTR